MGFWGPLLGSLAASVVGSKLNKPSGQQKQALASQTELAKVQTQAVRDQERRKRELEKLIGGLSNLSGEEKNALIRLFPGKETDFSGVRGTGDIGLLMQLAGLGGSGTGAVNAAAALAQGDISAGRQSTSEIAELIAMLLFSQGGAGLGAGGVLGPGSFVTPTSSMLTNGTVLGNGAVIPGG